MFSFSSIDNFPDTRHSFTLGRFALHSRHGSHAESRRVELEDDGQGDRANSHTADHRRVKRVLCLPFPARIEWSEWEFHKLLVSTLSATIGGLVNVNVMTVVVQRNGDRLGEFIGERHRFKLFKVPIKTFSAFHCTKT